MEEAYAEGYRYGECWREGFGGWEDEGVDENRGVHEDDEGGFVDLDNLDDEWK